MEKRGVRVKADSFVTEELYELRPSQYYSVPIVAYDGDNPKRAVNVGEKVKEGSLIASPSGKYGTYVYSPVAGKVVSIIKKLNPAGVMCEHVVIHRDMTDETLYLKPLSEFETDREVLLKRLYESGIIDNVAPYDPCYKKYLSKNTARKLIINACPLDPYAKSADALIVNNMAEVAEGARYLMRVAGAEKAEFIFTRAQVKLAKKFQSYLSKNSLGKSVKVKFYPNIYPLWDARLIAYYESGKMVAEGVKTAEVGIVVDTVNNCFDFCEAVKLGRPAIRRAVTVAGNNCHRKSNYFIKNGTSIQHVLDVVGVKDENAKNKLVYGGIMSGIAQESTDVSVSLSASTLLFCDSSEFLVEDESPCINCGKCLESCPVRLNVKKLDMAFADQRYGEAARLKVSACIGCGACSFVCPSKRNLTQRMKYMKDYALGKRAKNPNSSEYVLIEGEDLRSQEPQFDSILDGKQIIASVKKGEEKTPEIEKMLLELEKKTKEGKSDE